MRKIALCLGVAASALATPGWARDGEGYIGIDGGAIFADESDFRISGTDAGELDFQTGWEAAGQIGYDFGVIRAELEGSYREFNPDTVTVGPIGLPSPSNNSVVVGTFDSRGEMRLTTVMANAMLDFGRNDGIGFSIGAGAGRTFLGTELTTISVNNESFINEDERDEWAWQGIAALRIPVTDTFDVGIKYKYFDTHDFRLTDARGRTTAFDLTTHSALVSVLLNFGGAEPPPLPLPPPVTAPLPPPVTQPSPPPRVSCNTGPYIVFFDWDSSEVTPEAATVLNSAITAYGNCGTVPIMLAGYTDRSGTVQYNMGLAARRNSSVRDYLMGRGIPTARIATEAFGEANPRVPTADGVRELQNRRVEITYGPGSGM